MRILITLILYYSMDEYLDFENSFLFIKVQNYITIPKQFSHGLLFF